MSTDDFNGDPLGSDNDADVDDSDLLNILRANKLQAGMANTALDLGAAKPPSGSGAAKSPEEIQDDLEDIKAREAKDFLKSGPLNLNDAKLLERERLEDPALVARINTARASSTKALALSDSQLSEKRVATMRDFSAWVGEFGEATTDFESLYGELFSLANKFGEIAANKRPHGFPEDAKMHLPHCQKLANDLAGRLEALHETFVKLKNRTTTIRRDHEAVIVGL